ncbi:PVC-type heme-binding CxxCH protein [Parapedobacter sp. 10938]|nr:PVC-type heme-binding CxxCH protein [Parapedobacter sp. 10938]MEC3879452.1 PVC-type heme-binding CxxCH protein [Parapedobacter sp. 10938]
MGSFELAAGFQIELISADPLISDPVAMEVDEYGRMYVVEMHGYPLDKSGSGTVKLLHDDDGDGVMDRSEVFAGDLQFPTGVMRWKQGILVTDAPNLLYFEDSDGDGRAEVRDTLLTGFALSNPQHNMNTPMYGIDNWIYLSNEPAGVASVYTEEFSDLGTEVHYPGVAGAPVLPANGGGRRVRLRPDRNGLEMLSSAGQFGHTEDRWGRQFLVSNANHIYHEVFQAEYLDRNPGLLIPGVTVSVSDHGPAAEVYPITVNPEHQLLTDLGVFTAACGITSYQGGLFPAPFDSVVFVAEPVGNLVHADLVRESGATFTASRVYEGKEFLASRDPWFRPVNHYVGPDGALYVIDYYRRVVEHPEWMAEGAAESQNLYDGIDRGRIYRITPKGTPAALWTGGMSLGDATDGELVGYLSDKNLWYRRTAQRLLVDRKSTAAIPLLRDMLGSPEEVGRLHAAWALEGLGALEEKDVLGLLEDPVAGIRENGIKLSESYLSSGAVRQALTALQGDGNGRVRFQLLCTLGGVDDAAVAKVRESMLFAGLGDPWMQYAALSAASPDYKGLLNTAIGDYSEGNHAYTDLIQRVTSMSVATAGAADMKALINRALQTSGGDGSWQAALLRGLAQRGGSHTASRQLELERRRLVGAIYGHRYESVSWASLELLGRIGLPGDGSAKPVLDRSVALLGDTSLGDHLRIRAIEFVAMVSPEDAADKLPALLSAAESADVQRVAVRALGRVGGTDITAWLIDRWGELPPPVREETVGILFAGEGRITQLIEALKAGTIEPSAVGWGQQVGLMAQGNDELRRRARAVFAPDAVSEEEKENTVAKYESALDNSGDVEKGLLLYQQHCAPCHQVGGEFGTAYGPDLATIRNRAPDAILKDILDPNLSIADGFDLWELTMADGEVRRGIIGSETPTSVTLRVYNKADEVIPRSDIASMNSLAMSLMPSGLEHQITPEEMDDLLTFIKKLN